MIGEPLIINGATFTFLYQLHVIPTIGFIVKLHDKSIYFSGDTFYDPY
jgi:ribonuclease BN (tRNA processing enzyme)